MSINKQVSDDQVLKAATAFGFSGHFNINVLGKGLINKTFVVTSNSRSIVLQQLNTGVFPHPENVQHNYAVIQTHLKNKEFFIPSQELTINGSTLWQDENENWWRAMEYVPATYSPDIIKNADEAYAVAACFSKLSATLQSLESTQLRIIIPRFHDLSYRHHQFLEAIQKNATNRVNATQQTIDDLQEYKWLISVFKKFSDAKFFPERIMHHDCKISNILFDKNTNKIICPIDLDTVMPGKFFSDVGDMIRTMSAGDDENGKDLNQLDIRGDIYKSIIAGYISEMGSYFTQQEIAHLHHSGLIMTYMQALRFMSDFLNGDVYYKTDYDAHNLDRARNQLQLLKNLESYLKKA